MDIDIEELAAAVLDQFDTESDDCYAELNDNLIEMYGLDIDQFDRLVRKLLPMIDVGASPLTGNLYKGFATAGMWMAKMPIPSAKATATEGRKDE